MGKIAVLDGNSAALKAAKKINSACIDSTIRVFKRKYQELQKKNRDLNLQERGFLAKENVGRPKKIGEYDAEVQTNDWARSLLRHMKFVKREGTKAAKKVPENFVELGDQFKARIHSVKTRYQIPLR